MRNLLIVILGLALSGCSYFRKQETPVIISNDEKDKYIDKVEAVVSEATSALVVITPSVPAGINRELFENQVTRLSGISKPSVQKVEEYKKVVAENDTKAVKADKEKAARVDKDTDALWALVEKKDGQIAIQKALADNMEAKAKRETKDKILWMASCIGMAMFVASIALFVFTNFKKEALVVGIGGIISTSLAWILDTNWFEQTAKFTLILAIAMVAVRVCLFLYGKRNASNVAQGDVSPRTPVEQYPQK